MTLCPCINRILSHFSFHLSESKWAHPTLVSRVSSTLWWSQHGVKKWGVVAATTHHTETRPAADEKICLLEKSQQPRWVLSPDRFGGKVCGNSFFLWQQTQQTIWQHSSHLADRRKSPHEHQCHQGHSQRAASVPSAILYSGPKIRNINGSFNLFKVTAFRHSSITHFCVNVPQGFI